MSMIDDFIAGSTVFTKIHTPNKHRYGYGYRYRYIEARDKITFYFCA